MLDPVFSLWYWFGSNRPGFFLGTALLLTVMGLMYSGGVQASLSLGPGGDFPGFRDLLLYAFSHDEFPSLLINAMFLLLVGPCQERRWGTVAFLTLSVLSMAILPPLYTLVIFLCGSEASRISGHSATQLALFTAQCRQVTQRRLLRCVPVWLLPWFLLLLYLLLLPNTPALFHFCAICIGHNYSHPFIGVLQELEYSRIFGLIPDWACVLTSTRYRLPTYASVQRSEPLSHPFPLEHAATPPWPLPRDPSSVSQRAWLDAAISWPMEGFAGVSETQLLEEQMFRAGIQASLQDVPEDLDAKVEVSKSSVSSLRLQQLERMGFSTEKAVVALAASKQLDGAISLLIDDRVGEQAVVMSKGKSSMPPHSN